MSTPFGTDLAAEEIALSRALKYLEARTDGRWARVRTVAAALRSAPAARHAAALKCMGLDQPRGFNEYLQQRLVALGLNGTAAR